MEQKTPKKKNGMKAGIAWAVVLVVLTAGVIVAFMTNGTTTRKSTGDVTTKTDSLYCSTANPKDGFFNPGDATGQSTTIKVVFDGDRADKISYHFEGSYASANDADTALAKMHAAYNNYMGENGLSAESLSPTFASSDGVAKINLYADTDKLNSMTAKLFFLGASEVKNSAEQLQKAYSSGGFSCNFRD